MFEILTKQELYKELKKLKTENRQLKEENLFLHKHLADMAEFTRDAIGLTEFEEELEKENRNEKIYMLKEVSEYLDIYSDSLSDIDLSKPIVAKLDLLVWGKSANLILLFSNDDLKFKISVFSSNGYMARDKSFCFRDLYLIGKEIELILSITKKGYVNIQSAKLKE